MIARRILINASFAPSLVNFRGRLIAELVAQGHHVVATAPDLIGEVARSVDALGARPVPIRLSRAGLSPVGDLLYWRELRWQIRHHRIDLVFGYTIKPAIWGSLAAQAEGVESVSLVTGLGFAFGSGKGLVRKLVRAAARELWRRATDTNRVVIFQNPDDRADFLAAGALRDASKARMINGSGVDLAFFAPAPLPSAPVFLMIARLLVAKGVREYAAAALALKRRHPSWRFLLVGFLDEGPDGVSARELDEWQQGGIEFLGEQKDVRPALRKANVYVLPSHREGTPRSVLEAMAMGRPVITTDAPGCRETVQNGLNGLLVPVKDVATLSQAMQRLGSDSDLRQRYGRAGFELACEKYAVEEVNRVLLGHLGL